MATIIKKQTIEREVEKVFADAKLTARVSTDIQNTVVSFCGTIYTGDGNNEAVANYNFAITPYYGGENTAFDEAKYANYVKDLILDVETQLKTKNESNI